MRLLILAPPTMPAFDQRVLAPILKDPSIQIAGAVIDAKPPKPLGRRLREELKRGRGGFVIVMALNKVLSRSDTNTAIPSDVYFKDLNAPIHRTPSLYDPATLAWIRAHSPDALYRIGFGIIREPILSIAPHGVLSYHHGDIRRYRGQPPAFWELYHGEPVMGVTVQQLDAGIDCGRIVAEAAVPVHRKDSWRCLNDRAYAASYDLLHAACRSLQTPTFTPTSVPADQLGRVFTTPNLRQWLGLQFKVLFRRLTPTPAA